MKSFALISIFFSLINVLDARDSLAFEKRLVEVQAPADARTVKAEFNFTNNTNEAVIISKFDASCSCMAVEVAGGKLKYLPGESGVVRATFDMGNFSGAVDKAILLWVDDDPQDSPSITLTTRVHIPVLVAIEPKTLSWNLGEDPAPRVIRILMKHDNPIHVLKVTGSSQAFSHDLKTIREGAEYELTITPNEIDAPSLAIFRIQTDCEIKRHQTHQAFAVVRRPVAGGALRRPEP